MDLVEAREEAEKLYRDNPDYRNTCHILDDTQFCFKYTTRSNSVYFILDDQIVLIPELYEDPFLVFTILHNMIHGDRGEAYYRHIHDTAQIGHYSVIGTEGLRFAKADCGTLIPFRHIGRVFIGAEASIGPFNHIQRGTFKDTEIHKGVKTGPHVSIGHGAKIDDNTIITAGSHIGGSAIIGKNCFIGIGSSIRNSISISDNVMIGMGSVVVRDIKEPNGIYYGNPAQYHGEWNGEWRTR